MLGVVIAEGSQLRPPRPCFPLKRAAPTPRLYLSQGAAHIQRLVGAGVPSPGPLASNVIYLFLAVLGLHCCVGFSLVVASRSYSLVACSGFSPQWLHLSRSTGSRAHGLQWLWLLGPRAQAQ